VVEHAVPDQRNALPVQQHNQQQGFDYCTNLAIAMYAIMTFILQTKKAESTKCHLPLFWIQVAVIVSC
jgi:hypothetical protein